MTAPKLRLALLLGLVTAFAAPAQADDVTPPKPAENMGTPPAPPPQPDMNKPVTITLGQLQILMEAATAKGVAEAREAPAQAILQGLVQQATPKPDAPK